MSQLCEFTTGMFNKTSDVLCTWRASVFCVATWSMNHWTYNNNNCFSKHFWHISLDWRSAQLDTIICSIVFTSWIQLYTGLFCYFFRGAQLTSTAIQNCTCSHATGKATVVKYRWVNPVVCVWPKVLMNPFCPLNTPEKKILSRTWSDSSWPSSADTYVQTFSIHSCRDVWSSGRWS